MRTFSSYGPVDPELHYYVPRQELVNFAYQQLLGKNIDTLCWAVVWIRIKEFCRYSAIS